VLSTERGILFQCTHKLEISSNFLQVYNDLILDAAAINFNIMGINSSQNIYVRALPYFVLIYF
jgi:hypothetical protein